MNKNPLCGPGRSQGPDQHVAQALANAQGLRDIPYPVCLMRYLVTTLSQRTTVD